MNYNTKYSLDLSADPFDEALHFQFSWSHVALNSALASPSINEALCDALTG